jgi:hypothetical protein
MHAFLGNQEGDATAGLAASLSHQDQGVDKLQSQYM